MKKLILVAVLTLPLSACTLIETSQEHEQMQKDPTHGDAPLTLPTHKE